MERVDSRSPPHRGSAPSPGRCESAGRRIEIAEGRPTTWLGILTTTLTWIALVIGGVVLSLVFAIGLLSVLSVLIARWRGESWEEIVGSQKTDDEPPPIRFEDPVTIHLTKGSRLTGVMLTGRSRETFIHDWKLQPVFQEYVLVILDDSRFSLLRPDSILRVDLPVLSRIE